MCIDIVCDQDWRSEIHAVGRREPDFAVPAGNVGRFAEPPVFAQWLRRCSLAELTVVVPAHQTDRVMGELREPNSHILRASSGCERFAYVEPSNREGIGGSDRIVVRRQVTNVRHSLIVSSRGRSSIAARRPHCHRQDA